MATPPINPPFWMYQAGQPNMIVTDVNGYNAALAMGFALTANPPTITNVPQVNPSTASTNTSTDQGSGMGGITIVDTSINPQQPDPYQPVPQG